ncbi:hypothetical protein E2320_019955, partial [Naja naja]
METEVLPYIVNIYSNDTAMDFQLSKCALFVENKLGFGIEMRDRSKLRGLAVENSNKNLSILQANNIRHMEVKPSVTKKHIRK